MGHKTILLVEDDYLDIKSMERALKKKDIDCSLRVAHNGVDALEMLTGNKAGEPKLEPDLIILDINMPKMNGIEFLTIIKNYYSFHPIKVFILTTSAEEYDRIAAENLGVDGYIIKPFEFYDPGKKSTVTDSVRLLSNFLLF